MKVNKYLFIEIPALHLRIIEEHKLACEWLEKEMEGFTTINLELSQIYDPIVYPFEISARPDEQREVILRPTFINDEDGYNNIR